MYSRPRPRPRPRPHLGLRRSLTLPPLPTSVGQGFGSDYGQYLKADFTIECVKAGDESGEYTDYYSLLFVYAIIMTAVFPIGVPLLYMFFLYRKKKYINPPAATKEEALAIRSTPDYKVRRIAVPRALWRAAPPRNLMQPRPTAQPRASPADRPHTPTTLLRSGSLTSSSSTESTGLHSGGSRSPSVSDAACSRRCPCSQTMPRRSAPSVA